MSIVSLASEARHEAGGMVAGLAVGKVTNNQDPEGLGRVKLHFHWREDNFETDWARIAAPMAGAERGMFFLPEVGDEVLVAFDRDDIRYPYVLGALWSKTDLPPERNQSGRNDIRIIKSRGGHVVTLDDTKGDGRITIALADGKKVELTKDGITASDNTNTIELKANGGTVTITAGSKIALEAPQISIKAGARLELNGGGELSASAGMVRIN